jgi:4-deoxy-L-threo-5-hexosulose-uronate ketol-isomerase
MVEPKTIGQTETVNPRSPAERKVEGRAVVPGQSEIRSVELFDARPVVNQRTEIITGDNSTFRFLRFARILLDTSVENHAPIDCVLSETEEALFYINRGPANLSVGGSEFKVGKGDVLYVGLGETVTVSCASSSCDVSEFRAVECHTKYPVQLVRHSDIEGTELAADLGSKRPMSRRTVFKLVDQNVDACRLLFGDTYMEQAGGVGSYPPHFHGPDGPYGLGEDAKEEIYHFRCESTIEGDKPYVLQNCSRPGEDVNTYVHIFDEQAINVTPSYHDTIAPPAIDFMFTWCLGAFKENNRDWYKILNRPLYEDEW